MSKQGHLDLLARFKVQKAKICGQETRFLISCAGNVSLIGMLLITKSSMHALDPINLLIEVV